MVRKFYSGCQKFKTMREFFLILCYNTELGNCFNCLVYSKLKTEITVYN